MRTGTNRSGFSFTSTRAAAHSCVVHLVGSKYASLQLPGHPFRPRQVAVSVTDEHINHSHALPSRSAHHAPDRYPTRLIPAVTLPAPPHISNRPSTALPII